MGQPSSREKYRRRRKGRNAKGYRYARKHGKQPTGLLQRRIKIQGNPGVVSGSDSRRLPLSLPKGHCGRRHDTACPHFARARNSGCREGHPRNHGRIDRRYSRSADWQKRSRKPDLDTPEELISPLPEAVLAEEPVKVKEESPVATEKLKKAWKNPEPFLSRLKGLFSFKRGIDESTLEELEDILLGADIGAKSVQN